MAGTGSNDGEAAGGRLPVTLFADLPGRPDGARHGRRRAAGARGLRVRRRRLRRAPPAAASRRSTPASTREARRVARRTLRALGGTTGPIVVPSGSCGAMMRVHWRELFHGDRDEALARDVAGARRRVVDRWSRERPLPAPRAGTATRRLPRLLPRAARAARSRTRRARCSPPSRASSSSSSRSAERCCGFGGTFSVRYPDVSVAMADSKLADVEQAGVDALVSGDGGCLLHLGGRLSRTGSQVRALHLASLLAEALVTDHLTGDDVRGARRRAARKAVPAHRRSRSAVDGTVGPLLGAVRGLRPGRRCGASAATSARTPSRTCRSSSGRFADACEAAGTHVHFAADAAEANRIVTGICQRRRREAGREVEVDAERGARAEPGARARPAFEVVETDLGEYVVQLDGDRPSHVIAPIIHKTQGEVRELFSRVAGHELGDTARRSSRRSPARSCAQLPARRRRHHRLQLRGRRDGHGRARHERGQRAAGDRRCRASTSRWSASSGSCRGSPTSACWCRCWPAPAPVRRSRPTSASTHGPRRAGRARRPRGDARRAGRRRPLGDPRHRLPGRSSTASAAAPARTSAPSTGRSAATPTAGSTAARSAPS